MSVKQTLKQLFPISYKKTLLGAIIYYVIAAIVAGLIIWLATLLTGWIPVVGAVIGWVLGIAGAVVEIYVVAGIIVAILKALKVVK